MSSAVASLPPFLPVLIVCIVFQLPVAGRVKTMLFGLMVGDK